LEVQSNVTTSGAHPEDVLALDAEGAAPLESELNVWRALDV
jgi:hypothetical protein